MIETKHAALDTLAVTIQALHVSGKQMTLAVFRQLPVRGETPDSELWGIVLYDIKDQGSRWLVFSDSGVLYRRSIKCKEPTTDYQEIVSCDITKSMRNESLARGELERVVDDGYTAGQYPYDCAAKKLTAAEGATSKFRDELSVAQDKYRAAMKKYEYENGLINDLPQLFIAV